MNLDEQAIKYRAMDGWFSTPQGVRVAQAFAAELKEPAELFSGQCLLQLGAFGESPWLSELQFHHKWFVNPYETLQSASLVSSLTSLPIARSSMDCVILPLTLEAFGRDKNPIDEIDRVLKPMGYAVFFGVNPWSFWGASLCLGGLDCFGTGKGRAFSSLSLKQAMISRGYSQCMLSSFYYIPPVTNKTLINHLEFLNQMGKMIWPFPAGFYCLIMQKYQPVGPTALFNQYNDDLLYVARN